MFPRGGITYHPNRSPRQQAASAAVRRRGSNDPIQPADNAQDLKMLLRLALLVSVAVTAVALITSFHS